MASTSPPSQYVFVDDSDPSIMYSGTQSSWVATSHMSVGPVLAVGSNRSPWYGTLHRALADGASLSYSFSGSFISAHFLGGAQAAISSCTLDGNSQAVIASGNDVVCLSDPPQPSGQHTLTIVIQNNTSFDGLYYVPGDSEQANASMDKVITLKANLSTAGDAYDFTFNGRSLALFSVFGSGGIDGAAHISYNIDGGTPLNFTWNKTGNDNVVQDQAIVQTAQYPAGGHTFHLEILSVDNSKNITVPIDHVVVQNSLSTSNLQLDTIPPGQGSNSAGIPQPSTSTLSIPRHSSTSSIPQPSSTSSNPPPSTTAQPSSHRLQRGAMVAIGVVVPVVLILIIVGIVILLRKRRASTRLEKSRDLDIIPDSEIITPFQVSGNTPTSDSRTAMQPPSKLRGLYTAQHEKQGTSSALSPMSQDGTGTSQASAASPSDSAPSANASPVQAIYRIHEDGGSIVQTGQQSTSQVIDMPPVYSTLLGHGPRGHGDLQNGT
ncbi:hypothetical protein CPC08DRAFT_764607 [Agrocybe pediades]|nr:hypothetical protein CPC08DRAFT_764607 [Agrocybe pediades]